MSVPNDYVRERERAAGEDALPLAGRIISDEGKIPALAIGASEDASSGMDAFRNGGTVPSEGAIDTKLCVTHPVRSPTSLECLRGIAKVPLHGHRD